MYWRRSKLIEQGAEISILFYFLAISSPPLGEFFPSRIPPPSTFWLVCFAFDLVPASPDSLRIERRSLGAAVPGSAGAGGVAVPLPPPGFGPGAASLPLLGSSGSRLGL